MKYIIGVIAAAALVAACQTTAKADEAAKSWTGCYLEGSVGMGIGELSAMGVTLSDNGITGGIGAGCDYQIDSQFVIGAVGRLDFNDIGQSIGGDDMSASASTDMIWSLAARLGYLVRPDILVYGLVGGAWTDIDFTVADDEGSETAGSSFQGWLLGVGSEFRFSENVSIGGEYSYLMLDSEKVGGEIDIEPDVHMIRLRLGYRF